MTTLTAAPSPSLSAPARAPGADPRLEPIRAKVLAGRRLSLDEGAVLYDTHDIWGVIALADLVRRRMHGNAAYYNINKHLNYSNVCALSCKFCEFYRKKGDDGAYTRDLEYIQNEARKAVELGATEMHIVGGLNPYLPFEYYTDMLRAIHAVAPGLHLKAFTAVELVHLARIAKVYKRDDPQSGVRWVLERLMEAGLGSLPGGGAEVFDDRIQKEAWKTKIGADEWLDVHLVAHELGLNSNCTMLYGHIDGRRERLNHLEILRRSQDKALARLGYTGDPDGFVAAGIPQTEAITDPVITLSGEGAVLPTPQGLHASAERGASSPPIRSPMPGDQDGGLEAPRSKSVKGGYYQTIIPLPFFPDGSELEHLPGPTGLENLRTIAVARLMLDNFPHVKAFWIMQTLPMAQLMLEAGADDIDGTVVWYDITKVGGSSTHQEKSVTDLKRAIREAGFEPIERDTLYRRVVRDGKDWRVE
ncbi:radical SAM protein [Nodularia spumigena]|uniref:radical SAM protein n=1 Tax=Nodularia spumigena TaxID=70799 RepID=UPI002B20C13F|nr:radical SAM protein [Nodularia spumigena]MEA5612376.1 radical SAM protein [Nodularia spumigena UHCC 0040]